MKISAGIFQYKMRDETPLRRDSKARGKITEN